MQWNNYRNRFGVGVCVIACAAMTIGSFGTVRADSLAKTSGLAGASLIMDSIVGDQNKIITVAADTTSSEVLPELLETINAMTNSDVEAEEAERMLPLADEAESDEEDTEVSEEETAVSEDVEETVEDPVEEIPAKNADAEEIPEETAEEQAVAPAEESAESTEESSEVGAEETAAEEVREAAEEPVQEVSKYQNVGISIASNYVNIRTEPNTEAEIVAKLYKGCKCDILEQVEDWVKISSGNASGYIKEEFLARGFAAEALIDTYGTKYIQVETETLRVREEPDVESKIATLVPMGQMFLMTDEKDGWYEISIDDGEITGWVSAEFVSIHVRFKHAVTIEEEEAEARRQREAEEALAAQQRAMAQRSSTSSSSGTTVNSNKSSSSNSYTYSSSGSGTGAQIAAFAQRFVGNPYVYGGTSLTNGADCSGFVQSVYANFGYSLPRTSASQCAGAGYQVSLNNLKAGDLIFYAYGGGGVSHVAMYIGNGRVVHASDPSTGIITQAMDYRSIYMAKRIVD